MPFAFKVGKERHLLFSQYIVWGAITIEEAKKTKNINQEPRFWTTTEMWNIAIAIVEKCTFETYFAFELTNIFFANGTIYLQCLLYNII